MSNQAPIGTATMLSDGTIVMELRAEGDNGLIGMATIEQRPGDGQKYIELLQHLGGIKPGESKLIPPWS